MFCVDASSIGLFHECISLLFLKKKKKDFLYFISHIKKNRFDFLKLSTNLNLFIYKIDLIFFFFFFFYIQTKNHFLFFIFFTLFQNRSNFFTYKSKTNFFIHKNGFGIFFFLKKEEDAFINKFMWLSLAKCSMYATYHSYHA